MDCWGRMERYDMLDSVITSMIGETTLDYTSSTPVEQQLKEGRRENITLKYSKYRLTKGERAYWQKKEEAVEKPFTLQYAGGFENMIGMSGCYMSLLMVTFLVAVVVSRIFAEEHARRVDQLALSSRFGKKQLYYAKILAGTVFTGFSTLFLTGMISLITFVMYGTEGASAAIQLIAGWYSYPLSVGEIMLIMLGIIFLAALLTSIFTMVISEKLKSSALAMAVVIFCIVDIRLINIPSAYKVLSQIWNFWPINMVLLENFLDLRLVSLFGVKLTCWQFVPILYILAGTVLVLIGKRIYCKYQVQD